MWDQVTEPLKVRVSEKNFEIWLSSVRFFSSNESRLVLHVPTPFFQDYLKNHYTAVIEEELENLGAKREVVFEVGILAPQEEPQLPKEVAPIQEILPKEELSTMSPKRARREAARDKLKERCCVYQFGRSTFIIAEYSSKLKLLEAEEAEEDRREKIEELRRAKDALDEARRDQQAKPSHHWSDDKLTTKKIRQLLEQIVRDEKNGTPKRE